MLGNEAKSSSSFSSDVVYSPSVCCTACASKVASITPKLGFGALFLIFSWLNCSSGIVKIFRTINSSSESASINGVVGLSRGML